MCCIPPLFDHVISPPDISMGATCKAPSVVWGNVCERAIDGNDNTDYFENSCYHSAENQNTPWMQIDLGATSSVDKITVVNRLESSDPAYVWDVLSNSRD